MNRSFVAHEWGAVTFVLTVLIGLVVVPIGLYFADRGQVGANAAPAAVSSPSPSPSASASTSPSPSR